MGHYSKQHEEHYQSLEKAIGTPHIKSSILCAPSGYIKPLKESDGKAEDARFCFLADIADAVDEKHSALGEALSSLVRGVENKDIDEAKFFCYEVIHELSADESIMNDLIGVRAQALSSGKYTFESYREKIDINLLLDAAARHFLKILFIDSTDEESGFPHTAHIVANIIMIHTQLNKYGL